MPDLCVNVDHVATVRQARRGDEPDPLAAAVEAELGGAAGITVHLREDRRHIQDADVRRLRHSVQGRFNLEMAATDEMVRIACEVRPHSAMLVPERREEITTEGGLDVIASRGRVAEVVRRLADHGVPVSVFIDPDPRQVEAAHEVGAAICELHTGVWAHAFKDHGNDGRSPQAVEVLAALTRAADAVRRAGLRLNAGHGLTAINVSPVARLPGLVELHIGHSIVSRSILLGMRLAVREMIEAMDRAARMSPAG
ncbi:MAG: pyridoxine 5'-phosphate synthase [Phycisphaeraceae bacterium]|nr:pyridoxine 5'-phosphate synthase [Phycisphaeraceae bacterium]